MKTSVINHPPREPLIVIRQWQLEFCEGNVTAAALMSFFEYWHNIKLEISTKNRRANEVAEMHGDEPTADTSGFQWHTEAELITGIISVAKNPKTVNKGLDLLVAKGVLTIHNNPNPRYKFDKTRFFLFDPDPVNNWLSRRGKITASTGKNTPLSSKSKPLSSKSRSAITETTSEITNRDISLEEKSSESEPFSEARNRAREPYAVEEELQRGFGPPPPVLAKYAAKVAEAAALKLDTQIMGEEDKFANVFGDNPRQDEIDAWKEREPVSKNELLLHAMTGGVGLDTRHWERVINESDWKLNEAQVRAIAIFQTVTEGYFALPTAKDRRGRWRNAINQHLDEALFEGRLEELYMAAWKELGPDIKSGKLTLYTTPGSFTNQMYSVMQRMAFEDSSEDKPLIDEQGALIL